ncbi:MAG: N-acetylglucosaminyl-phosphatidylinositol de-N-acetylase [Geoglossum umbratile]|nr:MAG: N-acetylglucosaminyl-phosphatidylinositol de-N-acetylase [Geoglossum umbratile]
MQWVTALAVPLTIGLCWFYTLLVQRSLFPKLRNKRICLLIAHPDDEAMFFAPTVLALTDPLLGNHVKILCLSSGDAEGLGETRKRELVKSGRLLGLRNDDDVFVVENKELPDSMTASWEPKLISSLLAHAFAPKINSASANQGPEATIDILITFDKYGVSSHPNHIALHHGARHFLSSIMKFHPGYRCPVTLYTLRSTSLPRKYSSILDALFTVIQTLARRGDLKKDPPAPLLFVSSPMGYTTAQSAMTKAHKSQMRWFRWGWIALGRYMVINDLRLEKAL